MSSSASAVGVLNCFKVLGFMRGGTTSLGSAPSARSCVSAAMALPSGSTSSSFKRCAPPVDQETAYLAKPRPRTRMCICSRKYSCVLQRRRP
eukprot:6213323-Pleurochrysis_carterae.AAC.2